MSARYQTTGEWRQVDAWRGPQYGRVTVEQRDLLDLRTRFVYSGGAFRVTLKDVPGMRTKTFIGESAHHQAAGYASDAATKCGDWRWRPDL